MRTILALLGTAVGYGIGVFVSDRVCAAIHVPDNPTKMPGAAIILACGAVFCVLCIHFFFVLHGRLQRAGVPHLWQTTFAALGTAIGPVIGYSTVYYPADRFGSHDVHAPLAEGAGLMLGAPIGALLFCLLGLYLGAALDGRSQRNEPQE